MTAVYIHIPFCLSKCPYCSFSSFACDKKLFQPYVNAVKKDLTGWRKKTGVSSVETLFVGGGTPTRLSSLQLGDIIDHSASLFDFVDDAEVSVEANPGTVDFQSLSVLREHGVNRISFGIQSLNDSELRSLGRIHSSSQASEAVKMAHRAGFSNINIDLMYGIPGQTALSWEHNLEKAMHLDVQHLALYQLSIEAGTSFFDLHRRGELQLPSEEAIAEMDEVTERMTRSHSFRQYEISNFAKPGYECRHNLTYWRNDPYIGVGAGAVSYWQGTRQRRISDSEKYINALQDGRSVIEESELLENEAAFRETVIIGLRMVQGVSLAALEQRFNIDLCDYYSKDLPALMHDQLIGINDTHCYLTPKGRTFANQVLSVLV